ncbi:MAG: hypothetical protein DME34_08550 [Verrucomicrobia bacterium]|nr:MAG: hypothetical protein DME34_08550 [Verrucomicrobiota bacterium]
MTNDSSNGKPLRTISFVIHATRGVVRDQVVRRKTMFALLVVALLLLFSGSTFLQGVINPRAHPFWFVLFWLVCAWLTITAMLLAIFDLLIVRLAGRRAKRQLRERLEETSNSNQ